MRSSSRHGGGSTFPWVWDWTRSPSTSPLVVGLDQIPLNFPLGCGPGPDPPQFPPWLWAWIRSPSISPLVVGLETPLDQTPPRTRHPPPRTRHPPSWDQASPSHHQAPLDQVPPRPGTPPTRHPPVDRILDTRF